MFTSRRFKHTGICHGGFADVPEPIAVTVPVLIAKTAEMQRPTSHPALLSSGEPQAPPFSIAVPVWDSSYNWRHTPRDLP